MPRADPVEHQRAIRAYHRASAALRQLHMEEWEALRAQFREEAELAEFDLDQPLPSGPAKGRRPLVSPYRVATEEDTAEARNLVAATLRRGPKRPEVAVLTALTRAGFLLMRAR